MKKPKKDIVKFSPNREVSDPLADDLWWMKFLEDEDDVEIMAGLINLDDIAAYPDFDGISEEQIRQWIAESESKIDSAGNIIVGNRINKAIFSPNDGTVIIDRSRFMVWRAIQALLRELEKDFGVKH